MRGRGRWWYSVLAIFTSLFLLGLFVIGYVSYRINQSEEIICDLLATIYQPTPEAPLPDPTDPDQARSYEIRNEIGKAIERYECPPRTRKSVNNER